MTLSADLFEETVDQARSYLRDGSGDSSVLAKSFAAVLVELASRCVFGVPCTRHYGSVHGQEAEELRAGVEQIIRNTGDVDDDRDALHVFREVRKSLIFLLDHIDARDSLSFREGADPEDPEATDVRRAQSNKGPR